MKITCWSDYACPYCYIGEVRLKWVIANVPELGEVELEMIAFHLDPDAGEHATGDTQTRFAQKYGLTMEHAGRSVEHISQMGWAEGLDFHYAETQFTNTMDTHRLTKLAQSKGDPALAQRVVDALFHAYFGESKELADKALLREIGVSCGLDGEEVKRLLESDLYRDEVILDEGEAARYGIHNDSEERRLGFRSTSEMRPNVDDQAMPLTAFQVQGGGYIYYQLRDLGKALGFNVGWSAGRGIFIETDKPDSDAD